MIIDDAILFLYFLLGGIHGWFCRFSSRLGRGVESLIYYVLAFSLGPIVLYIYFIIFLSANTLLVA